MDKARTRLTMRAPAWDQQEREYTAWRRAQIMCANVLMPLRAFRTCFRSKEVFTSELCCCRYRRQPHLCHNSRPGLQHGSPAYPTGGRAVTQRQTALRAQLSRLSRLLSAAAKQAAVTNDPQSVELSVALQCTAHGSGILSCRPMRPP